MKQILLAFILVLTTTAMFAQDCEPNMMYADSVGVFPLPYLAGVDGEPDTGGIPDTACVNIEYSTAFTIVVNTFTLSGIEVTPDWLVIDSVTNLPNGLTYQCNPADCTYYPSTPGCATIYGIPDDEPGIYSLQIYGTAYLLGGAFSQSIAFPDPNLAPGEYLIHLRAEGDANCAPPSSVEAPSALQKVQISPNPFSGFTQIAVSAETRGTYNFLVTDLLGRTINQEKWTVQAGENNFTYDGSNLANGVYIYTLSQGNKVVSGKMVLNQ